MLVGARREVKVVFGGDGGSANWRPRVGCGIGFSFAGSADGRQRALLTRERKETMAKSGESILKEYGVRGVLGLEFSV